MRTWRPFRFHTMGRGAEPQGLFSFHPAPPHCTRARRAGQIRAVPRASYADGVALGAPENPPSPVW
ncbi:hypothetical protein, partial [Dysosmobacter sp.]|uniref:hypothetical protein n=1 Tax=Dysosmobacter sp. TaxID=2591382 RepID=UPI003AB12368